MRTAGQEEDQRLDRFTAWTASLLISEVWAEHRYRIRSPRVDRRTRKEVQLSTPLSQCLFKCEKDDPDSPLFFSGKSMNFLFSFEARSYAM